MRFIIIVKTARPERDSTLTAALADYHTQLARAGVLLDGAALAPGAEGWRLRYRDGERSLLDAGCPNDCAIAGYALIQVRSRAEAQEWGRRFPVRPDAGAAAEVEVRALLAPAGQAGTDE